MVYWKLIIHHTPTPKTSDPKETRTILRMGFKQFWNAAAFKPIFLLFILFANWNGKTRLKPIWLQLVLYWDEAKGI